MYECHSIQVFCPTILKNYAKKVGNVLVCLSLNSVKKYRLKVNNKDIKTTTTERNLFKINPFTPMFHFYTPWKTSENL